MCYRETALTFKWRDWAGNHTSGECSIDQANRFMHQLLRTWLQKQHKMNLAHWHFAPQIWYLYDADGRITCDNVLRMETLTSDFNILMVENDLSVRLPEKHQQLAAKNEGPWVIRRLIEYWVDIHSSGGYTEKDETNEVGVWNANNYSKDRCGFKFPEQLSRANLLAFNEIYAHDFVELGYNPLCVATFDAGSFERAKNPRDCEEIRDVLDAQAYDRLPDDYDFATTVWAKRLGQETDPETETETEAEAEPQE
jgi:hypothetical protein